MKRLILAGTAMLMLCGMPAFADDWDDLYGALNSAMWMKDDRPLANLLGQGVDINTQNSDGWTLLHIAADQGKPAFVRMLLDRGADPTIKTNYGKTAFDVTGSAQIKRMLTEAMAQDGKAPEFDPAKAWAEARWAIEYNQQDELARLLDAGLDVNARNGDGWTLLMVAAWKGNLKSVEQLVRRGADKRARNNNGETAAQLTYDANVRNFLGAAVRPPAPGPTGSNEYCTRMYHEATRLCDTGSAGSFCRIQAANKAQACNQTGNWP